LADTAATILNVMANDDGLAGGRHPRLQLKLNLAFADLGLEGSSKQKRETAYCSKSNVNIGPDGKRYRCVTKAIRMEDPKCDIGDAEVTANFPKVLCHDFGHCVTGDLQEVGMSIERLN
jgi:hypothetical protein